MPGPSESRLTERAHMIQCMQDNCCRKFGIPRTYVCDCSLVPVECSLNGWSVSNNPFNQKFPFPEKKTHQPKQLKMVNYNRNSYQHVKKVLSDSLGPEVFSCQENVFYPSLARQVCKVFGLFFGSWRRLSRKVISTISWQMLEKAVVAEQLVPVKKNPFAMSFIIIGKKNLVPHSLATSAWSFFLNKNLSLCRAFNAEDMKLKFEICKELKMPFLDKF